MSHQVRTPQHDALNVDRGLESLQASAEFRGPVEPLDDAHRHHCNDHIALIHETREEQFAAVVPFVRQGLAADERCLYVLEDTSKDAIVSALREGGIEVDAALESGQLSFHTVDETYLRNERFQPDEMIEFYADAIAEATESYEGLRVAAETGWLLDDTTNVEDWMEYESRVNDLFADEDCVALCQYDRTRVPAEIIRDLVQTHPHIVYDSTVCHNFYYTPPEEFLGPDQPDNEVERMVRTLVERTRAKTKLEERERYLRELYDVTADADRSFEEQLDAVFELGCERFDVEFGGLARVDPDADDFRVEQAGGRERRFEPGTEFPLSQTYCAAAAESEGVADVTDPTSAGYDDITVYQDYGLRAYLGSYIAIEGGPDRTFFFVTSETREEPFSEDERTFHRIMGQWVKYELEQRQREARLDALNSLNQSLMTAETVDEATECLVDAAPSLGLRTTTVGLYDPTDGTLRPAGYTDRGESVLDPLSPFATGEGIGWEAFLNGELRRTTVAVPGEAGPPTETEVVAVPLNDNGVLVTALPASEVTDSDVDFVQTVAASVTTAMDRAHREEELHAREETLAERNETLTRLDRINTTIRNIDQALVSASSREEIESVACDRLTDAGPYTFAWIGKHDSLTDGLTPKVRAGAEAGYLEEVADGDPEPSTLADRAAAAREPRVVNDLLTDAAGEAWRQEALQRGYHAAVALPLVYEDTVFGVLTVFADQPGVFDDLEEAVLTELADNIAHAINAVENKRSLVSNDVTELTFEVPTGEFVFGDMVRETGGTFDHEGVVATGDDELRWFFSARGVDAEDVLAFESRLPVSSFEHVAERDGGDGVVHLFEARHAYRGLPRDLLEHGGRLHALRADGTTVTVTVDIHTGTDVREFVEMFRTKYDGAELVAKRDRERSLETVGEFRAGLTEDLTPRQREVLQTAYYSGYFEEPRTRTGGEIASSMDISQPTFTTHLRSAERKIYGELFDDA